MINFIKSLFCKHEWTQLRELESTYEYKVFYLYTYGCNKCGKIKKTNSHIDIEWRWKQSHKGRVVDSSDIEEKKLLTMN